MQRKLAAACGQADEGGQGADRSWRLALARAAHDHLNLDLDVTAAQLGRRSLAELLELPPDHSLIAVLEGPAEGLGLLVIDPMVLAGMVEALTLGKVGRSALIPRKPTRTDAAMVIEMIDAALTGLEVALAQEADLIWAGGFRYASFIEDPRPLGLLLEDIPYRVLTSSLSLAEGARQGQIMLAFPAEGRGMAAVAPSSLPALKAGPDFATALAAQVEAVDCVLDAVLSRVSLPLSRILQLEVGEVIALPNSGIDRIHIEGIDGRRVGEGRLGQNRGLRAVRLSPMAATGPASLSTKHRSWSDPVRPEQDLPKEGANDSFVGGEHLRNSA